MASDVVYDAILGTLTLAQVFNGNFSNNGTPVAGTNSGELDVDTFYGGPAEPRATFTSSDVGTVVGVSNICTAGLAVSSGTVTIPWQKRANQSTFAGSLSNFTVSGTNGLAYPTSFSVNQDDDAAVVNMEFVFRSTDGVTYPCATNASQSLTAQTFKGLYGLGPVNLEGAALGEVVGVTVNTGLEVTTENHNGGLYPDRIYIVRRRPSFDLMFNDFDDLNTAIPDAAWKAVSANCVVYMRQRSGVGYTANATATHVAFTLAAGIITPENISASGADSGRATIRVYGESLAATATSAIS